MRSRAAAEQPPARVSFFRIVITLMIIIIVVAVTVIMLSHKHAQFRTFALLMMLPISPVRATIMLKNLGNIVLTSEVF